MNIPTALNNLISQSAELTGAINLTLNDFRIWFEDRNMVFFPEYTDHGPKHIQEVMVTAESLIKNDSWLHVTSEDAAVLVLSIVLHDCAMHLSEDGFLELIDPKVSRSIVSGFNERSWPDLWADFLGEASRFDAKKLKALFGDTEPIRTPPLNPSRMNLRDRLLIGEFLRRHHARLAHEIALWGVPGPTVDKIKLVRVPRSLANLSGLIARSHNLDLRKIVETIPRIHRREHYKVHAPFLMAVVRIADYLQIQAERAPKQILNVRGLRSPVSKGEWKAHEALEEIKSSDDDPEAIVIIATPNDVKTYLKLDKLLVNLQLELDECWAVLGEVYGRVGGLQDLGLTIRRVKSNLDDKEEFSKTVSYYPDHIAFEADPEVLKLLIEPLYGEDGGIAVRELVQNGVDACIERDDYVNQTMAVKPEKGKSKRTVTIDLQIDDDSAWLTASDNGIGMTADVIRSYFLKAGASFRRSDAWKKQHETEDGRSRVLRSGRFGIGVLAAFLLGDEVEVTTRHISETANRGIHFLASVEDESIELQKRAVPAVGTTIKIKLTLDVAKRFRRNYHNPWDRKWDWSWYHLDDPKVKLTVSSKKPATDSYITETIGSEYVLPKCGARLPEIWHRVIHKDFDDIQWSFTARTNAYQQERLFCNGIKIKHQGPFRNNFAWLFSIREPVLSIFDSAGKLPLNLARSNLTRALPFERELLEDIYRDLIAYLLVHTPGIPPNDYNSIDKYIDFSYPGTRDDSWFWFTPDGLSLARKWFLLQVSPPHLYLVPDLMSSEFSIPKNECYLATFARTSSGFGYYDPWIRFALTGTGLDRSWTHGIPTIGRRVLIHRTYRDRIERRNIIPKTFLRGITEEWSDDDWVILSTSNCPRENFSFRRFAKQVQPDTFSALAQWYFDSEASSVETNSDDMEDPEYSYKVDGLQRKESLLLPIWRETIGDSAIIPFDFKRRKTLLSSAYAKLDSYVKAYEALRKEKAKRGKGTTRRH